MKFLTLKLQSVFLFLIAFAISALSQTPKVLLPDSVEEEVTRLLQNRGLTELSDELARQTAPHLVAGLLKNLSVFGRAGHRARVHETIKRLPTAEDFGDSNRWAIEEVAHKAIGEDDLEGQKLYYELIAVHGGNRAEGFTKLWQKKGDTRDLEKWLAARRQRPRWWDEWLRIKQELGTADEVYAELEREVRADPKDWNLIEKYIRSVMNSSRDISWLAATVPTDSAFDAYKLGTILGRSDLRLAAKLFEKSLSLPFSEKDKEKFGWEIARSVSSTPAIKNLEKQLRFWTKKALAETYRRNNQPQLAQPLVEELTATDTGDILPGEIFGLAGQVQADSGQRVVEAKILREEAQKQDVPQYWVERAQYYMGREEKEAVWQTIEQALAEFPYLSNDSESLAERLQIMNLVRWYGVKVEKKLPVEVFRREYARAENNAGYLVALTRLIADDFEGFVDEIFANKQLLPHLLAARPHWRDDELVVIKSVMHDYGWNPEKRDSVWNELIVLAQRDIRNRAYTLAVALTNWGQYRKAIPLLEECLKIAPEDFQDGRNFKREYVEKELFDAYLSAVDWQSAERMYRGGFNYSGDESGRVAVAAAKSGKIVDAIRLWKMQVNIDRRNLRRLDELAKTGAKPLLREFYLEMKKRDALTDVPDKALILLQ